jgi:23S rRNA (guanine2445-N2)-methyltransferase / 23S rRNA (guanine2069-N7)-methyltransferase
MPVTKFPGWGKPAAAALTPQQPTIINDRFSRPLATCAKGLEGLLFDELTALGVQAPVETVGGVYFDAPLQDLYRICLWSRLASRVLPFITAFEVHTAEHLEAGMRSVAWEQHLNSDSTFAINFHGTSQLITNSHFGALKAKDAIVDYFRERHGDRPSIDTVRPDLRLHLRLSKGIVTVRLDLAGESLHRRGYRSAGGLAPLKENLAAAVLVRAGWPAIAATGGALIDPMCGSGTLLIEGARIALDVAPGYGREYWGFSGWLGHVPSYWTDLMAEAEQRMQAARARPLPDCFGYDSSLKAIRAAEDNIASAKLDDVIRVRVKELATLTQPTHKSIRPGLVITNPPYGERLGDEASVAPLYRSLADRLKQEFDGWQGAMLTGNPNLGKTMGLRARKQYAFFNGTIPSKLLLFDINPQAHVHDPRAHEAQDASTAAVVLSEGAQMFANRLRKNVKALAKWRRTEGITCYRVYDADMPEYAVAIDVYDTHVHIAEYRAPASIDPKLAEDRLRDVLAATAQVLAVAPAQIVLKQRQRQRGPEQYNKRSSTRETLTVQEGNAKILVNLRDYLDTGLFLDHRKVRQFVGTQARGKRFLNLFCYTGTATVHAALGGASYSDSVDLSQTYLDWARQNLALNGFSDAKHRTIRANVMEWIARTDGPYDLIFVDPPTFSNSKSTSEDFDVQRDHLELLSACMRLLAPEGLLIFSNNKRKFELDDGVARLAALEDRTRWSQDRDFAGSKRTRQCWFLTHAIRTGEVPDEASVEQTPEDSA